MHAPMAAPSPIYRKGQKALGRIKPRLRARFAENDPRWTVFEERLERHYDRLFRHIHDLYGDCHDMVWQLEDMLAQAADTVLTRPEALARRDHEREQNPEWFRSNRLLGAVAYVDRFAGTLNGLSDRLDHLRDLDIGYLHLMPLMRTPPGNSDGGYAVSSYRDVAPHIGTTEQLRTLAEQLHSEGMSLCLDFVCNHTADDHPWAEAARKGDPEYQAYYHMYDDRTVPDAYAPYLRDIFPDRGSGCFTWREDVAGPNGGKWVWTTFYRFQWDLNFANPAVFNAMLGEMLFLANIGVDVLRLDAVPFLWKRLGTNCENQPEAHTIIRAFNALVAVACPALAFKSEAIVHPDEVARYIDREEAQLSYNPMLMVLMWESLATRQSLLARHALKKRFALPAGTSWMTYLRCHDDIGWGFADEDASEIGIDPAGHRQFLNSFYTGRFPGSFARGLPFQENPATGDCRISGMLASLAGLEAAAAANDAHGIDLAIARILMMHGVILTIGGIPLIYLGDEIGQFNDYSYEVDPARYADNRWVHRPRYDWQRLKEAHTDPDGIPGRVLKGMRKLIALRRGHPVLGNGATTILDAGSDRIICFLRGDGPDRLLIIANVSEHALAIDSDRLAHALGASHAVDHLSGHAVALDGPATIAPCQFAVLAPVDGQGTDG